MHIFKSKLKKNSAAAESATPPHAHCPQTVMIDTN